MSPLLGFLDPFVAVHSRSKFSQALPPGSPSVPSWRGRRLSADERPPRWAGTSPLAWDPSPPGISRVAATSPPCWSRVRAPFVRVLVTMKSGREAIWTKSHMVFPLWGAWFLRHPPKKRPFFCTDLTVSNDLTLSNGLTMSNDLTQSNRSYSSNDLTSTNGLTQATPAPPSPQPPQGARAKSGERL